MNSYFNPIAKKEVNQTNTMTMTFQNLNKAPPLNWFLKPFENLKEVNVTKS